MRIAILSRERGSALLITLVITSILGITLLSYLNLVHNQHRAVVRSESWNYAIAVSEAGIEEAMTQLYYSADNLASNDWTLQTNCYVKTRVLDRGGYIVQISNVSPPVIYSHGYVQKPDSTNFIPARTVRVTVGRNGLFRKGMVARGNIDLMGNNIMTDSFDSVDPAYSTNGRYDEDKAKDNGDVATNSTITNSLAVGNANLYGHVATGPGGNVVLGPNGSVGSRTWVDAGNKGIEAGYFTDDMNVDFPLVTPPFTTATAPSGGSVGGTNYTLVLGNGNYSLTELSMSGQNKMIVNGNAILYVSGDASMGGQSYIYIATNASLNLYVNGTSASLGGNGIMNANANATNFMYWGTTNNTSLSMSGNAAFTGIIYAPDAAFTLGGGGSTDYDFVGASVTASVKMNGHFKFHYDENIGRVTPNAGYIVTSWNEI
jgi:hypothetical protein